MQKSILSLLAAGLLLSCATAAAATRYVTTDGNGDGTSWATAMSNLQEAINASEAGDQVWVAAGTYKPTELIKSNKATSKAFMMKDGVSLYGGFSGTETSIDQRKSGEKPYDMVNATILSADDDVADEWIRGYDGISSVWGWIYESNNVLGTGKNSTHLLYSSATIENPTVIDGFTLTGANANVATAKPSGGAVYAPGKVAISNCRIVENSAYFTAEANDCNSYGGAVYLDGGSMDNCYIARAYAHSSFGNGYGGGVYAKNSTISNCVFEDCVASDAGGAVFMRDGSLTNCIITGCYGGQGGAIYNNGGTIEGISVLECRALFGGGVFNYGTLTNAVIAGCLADNESYSDGGNMGGGGIYNYGGDVAGVAVYNCTSWHGGGVYLREGRLINATVQNNSERDTEAGTANVAGDASSVLNSITAPDVPASNFVAPTAVAGAKEIDREALAAADWRLAPGSEFIDAGTPVEGFSEGCDLAGNARVAGASIDCGAYEVQAQAAEQVDLSELNLQIVQGATAYYETGEVTVVYANDDKTMLNIENFLGTGARIVATLDADGNVAIAPQTCGYDGDGNFLMIVNADSADGLPFEISNTRLYGKFDGSALTLDPWNLIVVPYTFMENLGTYFPENVTSKFVKSNGAMEYAFVDGGSVDVPVYAEEAGNGAVDVYGWGGYGMVTIRKENGSWAINSAAKAYYMEGAEYCVAAPDGDDVVCVSMPDARTLVFGAWQFKDMSSGKVVRDCSSAKVILDFDLPAVTAIDAAIAETEIVETTYYNAAGVGASQPYEGFNIRVDVLSDGTLRTTKLLVK